MTRTFVIQFRTLVPEPRHLLAKPGWQWQDWHATGSGGYQAPADWRKVREALADGSDCDFKDLDGAKVALSIITRPPEWEYRIIRRDVSVIDIEQAGTRMLGTRKVA